LDQNNKQKSGQNYKNMLLYKAKGNNNGVCR